MHDEVAAISSLSQALTKQLTESSERIKQLQTAARSLVSPQDYDKLSQGTQRIEFSGPTTDALLIHELEQQRLELVMDLQKQDYMADQLSELVSQNQHVLDSVRTFLTTEASRPTNFETIIQTKLALFENHIVKATKDNLEASISDAQASLRKAHSLVSAFVSEESECNKTLASPEYKRDVDELVSSLRAIYARQSGEGDLNKEDKAI